MRNKLIRLLERPLIEKKINPFSRRKLPSLLLTRPPLCTSTFFSNGMPSRKLRQITLMWINLRFRNGLRDRTLGCSHRTRF